MRKFVKRASLFFVCFLLSYPLLLMLLAYTGAKLFTSNFPYGGLYDYNRTRLEEVKQNERY